MTSKLADPTQAVSDLFPVTVRTPAPPCDLALVLYHELENLKRLHIDRPRSRSRSFLLRHQPQKVYKAFLTAPLASSAPPSTSGKLSKLKLDTTWDVDDTQPKPILLKYRFPKTYRHHSLNASITKQRIGTEARALVRCRKFGVKVPGVRMVDLENGLLGIEWIDGMSVRQILGGGADDDLPEGDDDDDGADGEDDVEIEDERVDHLGKFGISQDTLLSLIGTEIAKMHRADIIHGDLTTSNMMLRTRSPSSTSSSQPSSSAELLLIDFGLSSASSMPEDKAVDLYVLERAFSSTHPDSEPLFAQVLDAYGKETGAKWPAIEKRLDEVRMRGRKRSMVG